MNSVGTLLMIPTSNHAATHTIQLGGAAFIGSFDLDDHLNLHRTARWKRLHTYGGARVFANLFSKDLYHQIGKTIHDTRLVSKTFRRIDHAKNFDNVFNAVKTAKRSSHFRQHY